MEDKKESKFEKAIRETMENEAKPIKCDGYPNCDCPGTCEDAIKYGNPFADVSNSAKEESERTDMMMIQNLPTEMKATDKPLTLQECNLEALVKRIWARAYLDTIEKHVDLIKEVAELYKDSALEAQAKELQKDYYQLCPKCSGQGTVTKPPYVPGDVDGWITSQSAWTCDICNGDKTILVSSQKEEIDAAMRMRMDSENEWIKQVVEKDKEIGAQKGEIERLKAEVESFFESLKVCQAGNRKKNEEIEALKRALKKSKQHTTIFTNRLHRNRIRFHAQNIVIALCVLAVILLLANLAAFLVERWPGF